jgi:hypothetical protein
MVRSPRAVVGMEGFAGACATASGLIVFNF